jgi:hypothetical protein
MKAETPERIFKMKTLLPWKPLAVAMTAALLCAAPLAAQTSAIRVQIPFAFTAGTQLVPAGEYSVTVDSEHMLSVIAATDNTDRWLVRLIPGDSSRPASSLEKGLLRFERNGARYVLTGIWKAGWNQGNGVPHRRFPKEVAERKVVQDIVESR